MKLLWHDTWIDTPCYTEQAPGVLVDVELTFPLGRIVNATARVPQPIVSKVASFLVVEGPRTTARKLRAKWKERELSDDYQVVVVLGQDARTAAAVVGLGCRVPRAAEHMLVHERLVWEIESSDHTAFFARLVTSLEPHRATFLETAAQNFIYSDLQPPEAVVDLMEGLVRGAEERDDRPVMPSGAVRVDGRSGVEGERETMKSLRSRHSPVDSQQDSMCGAVLGGGDYVRSIVLPALREAGVCRHVLADREPQVAALVGAAEDFHVTTTDATQAIEVLPSSGLVVVATSHDSHARLASQAAAAGHRVFLEKPPTVTDSDVSLLIAAMERFPGQIEIGFNRRHSPLVLRAKSALMRESGPMTITTVVRELRLSPNHWYFWPNQGTRIAGNLCHWIDLCVFLVGSDRLPTAVTLSQRAASGGLDEERVLTVTFDDGSVGVIISTGRGDGTRGVQEEIEIRRGAMTVRLDDLWRMRVRRHGFDRVIRTPSRDKGHARMYRSAFQRMVGGQPAAYPVKDMVLVSAIQLGASQLLEQGELHRDLGPWLQPHLESLGQRGDAVGPGAAQ